MRIIFSAILLWLAGEVLAGNPSKTVHVSGTVSSPTAPEAELFLLDDPLFIAEKKYLLSLRDGSNFAFDLPLDEAGFAELKYGEATHPIWLAPGQPLEINFDGKNFSQSLRFAGAGAAANIFLKNFYSKFPDLPARIENFMAGTTPDGYKKFILDLAAERQKLVESDADFQQSPADFQVLFSKNENYWTGQQLLRFAFDKPLFEGKWEPLLLPDGYYNFLDRMHVSTRGLLQSPDYQAFLDRYIEFLKIQPEFNGKLSFEVAEKKLTGEALWLFQAREIAKSIRAGQMGEARRQFSTFETVCKTEILLAPLRKKLGVATAMISEGLPAPNFGLTDAAGKIVSLDDLRGKVIYLDFWATWCARCLEEMPKIFDLQKNLPAEKVAFVFVSFDKNPAQWRDFVKNRQFSGIQLWGEPMQNSEVARMFGVSALPTAFLIDEQGQVVRAASGGFPADAVARQILDLISD